MKVNINGSGHIKTFISLILQNRKTYDFGTLPEASVDGALQSLYKS